MEAWPGRRLRSATRIGDYWIQGRLARGGMAEVWLARTASGLMAVKTIREELVSDPRVVELFVREAAIGTRLRHPRIAHVCDFGLVDGIWFLAMEYVAGATMRELLWRLREDGRPAPLWFVVGALTRVCGALDYMHDLADDNLQGLLHNDLSPENIMVTPDGDVKVIDLGAATPSGVPARDGPYVGKTGYLPPELLLGGSLDRRSDVYSLGVILYEMTVGTKPFTGEPQTMVPAIALGKFRDPRAVNPEISDRLAEVILKAMALDPEERYPAARSLARDLRSLVHDYLSAEDEELGAYIVEVFPERELKADAVAAARPACSAV